MWHWRATHRTDTYVEELVRRIRSKLRRPTGAAESPSHLCSRPIGATSQVCWASPSSADSCRPRAFARPSTEVRSSGSEPFWRGRSGISTASWRRSRKTSTRRPCRRWLRFETPSPSPYATSFNDIRQRKLIYLPFITQAGTGSFERPVLDLGCGRGESLDVLLEQRLHRRGVDINRAMVNTCRERGLEVTHGQCLAFFAGGTLKRVSVTDDAAVAAGAAGRSGGAGARDLRRPRTICTRTARGSRRPWPVRAAASRTRSCSSSTSPTTCARPRRGPRKDVPD